MKLCPLFEKIELKWCDGESRAVYLCRRTIKAANAALPQEAIRYALECMDAERGPIVGYLNYYKDGTALHARYGADLAKHDQRADQLRALLTDSAGGE